MKKLHYFLAAAVLVGCQNETTKPKDYLVFSGTVTNPNSEKGFVGGHQLSEEFQIKEDGTFTDTLHIEEPGYYTFKIGQETSTFYLKNGEDINLSIDTNQFDESITYTGEGAEENNYLAQKYITDEKITSNMKDFYSLEEKEFVGKLDSLKTKLENDLELSKASEDFKELEKKNLMYERYVHLLNYPQYHGYFSGNMSYSPSDDFNANIIEVDLDNEFDAKKYNSYSTIVLNDFRKEIGPLYMTMPDSVPTKAVALIKEKKSPAVQAILMSAMAREISPEDAEKSKFYYDEFMKISKDEDFKEELTKAYDLVEKLAPGAPSPTFTYENHDGGTTSLADLKGKYVYVDVWATWCGPCKREIPFLKKVEEEYHNKNIEFVSISIDTQADHDKWKKFVDDEELGGTQLFADKDWKSEFVQSYGINAIPRFLLIDTEGNIVSASAPRPSNPKLKETFDGLEKI
ncbi:Thiol-disulfide isomerase or thioredoxin [Pustulibacterium marinum]|uniref:Thiol-disulfide isomerase or thioredoxin n=1 Tax=Pustulibacterium marinum TaxID=1224947 RepID=A0A1I7FNA6_9FLAO|nr:TlpA disulfide reductase family protein [Pustulibacterium marinum]SFU37697.1 Thiol-disulfide isomerase or thioredoxin [Pustulibacterium marinum]